MNKPYKLYVGVSQESVISFMLANLFLHYTFDKWMDMCYPTILFERYADDTVRHCCTENRHCTSSPFW